MNSGCCRRTNEQTAVLLARIVDSAGRAIRPSQVAAIRFSITPLKRRRRPTLIADLDPVDVVLPRLVVDEIWTEDVAGYNFRHEFSSFDLAHVDGASGIVELRYVFESTEGTRSIVRFRLKNGAKAAGGA